MIEVYPKEVKKFIQENVIGIGNKELTEKINNTFNTTYLVKQIKSYKKNHKLSSGLDGRFVKGQEPFNKGKKKYWVGGEETQFKKGNRPYNYKPVGTERVNGDDYVDIKVADPNKWKGKHIVIWEKHNGPLPRGKCIIFGDCNNRNFDPNNLICVSRKQLLILNNDKLIKDNADLTRIGVAIVDIKLRTKEIKKGKEQS